MSIGEISVRKIKKDIARQYKNSPAISFLLSCIWKKLPLAGSVSVFAKLHNKTQRSFICDHSHIIVQL